MRQTTLSVALEVKPESCAHLAQRLDALRQKPSRAAPASIGPYADFLAAIPALHFMSLSIFRGYDFDPLFIIEANFDGAPGPFWAQLEHLIGDELRACLRCCKQPLDKYGPLFTSITDDQSRAPIAPYLEARSLTPTVYHHGNRGLPRDRILAEFALFKATRHTIAADDAAYRAMSPARIHAQLRTALQPDFAWLDQPAPPRITSMENLADWLGLGAFVILAILGLSAPGLILALITSPLRFILLLVAAFLVLLYLFRQVADPLPNTATPTKFRLLDFLSKQVPAALVVLACLAVYVVGISALATPIAILLKERPLAEAWAGTLLWIALGLLSVPVTVLGLLVCLRILERGESSQDAPPVDPVMLREMARREDWIPQNHMGSLVLIKPGLLRAVLIRAGHFGLGRLLRIIARNGYLGSMRTIHFAHWAMVNNNSRLLFFSNFDQTWESYLDDFIEKAHIGLTLAWGCGVGFPPARFLIFDGASRGRQFKDWARHSMAVSRFWYSAYRDLTAEQVERNYRLALGLRKPSLSDQEATLWIKDL